MKALAITDHGPELGGRLSSPFFDRLFDPMPGVRLLKGIECNLLEKPGEIDLPSHLLPHLDIVLLGIHPNTRGELSRSEYTDRLLCAMRRNQCVDVITHPDAPGYDLDFGQIVSAAREYGMLIEINNSKSRPGIARPEVTRRLIRTCRELECPVVMCSDAHAVNEVGEDAFVRPLLEEEGFPWELVINRDLETAVDFIERRRERKRR